MDKLTIEEKAKAYDFSLKRAKRLYEQGTITESLSYVFPQLKKLGDGEVRKEIMQLIQGMHDADPRKERWLAWLEKQKTSEEAMQYLKENHSPSEVSDFQTAMNIAVAKAYDKGVKDGLENKGQTFTKKDVDDAWLKGMCDAKQELEKQCGQNPAWSEEDEKMVNNILTPLAGRFPWNIYQPMYDWLKSLKQRIKL